MKTRKDIEKLIKDLRSRQVIAIHEHQDNDEYWRIHSELIELYGMIQILNKSELNKGPGGL